MKNKRGSLFKPHFMSLYTRQQHVYLWRLIHWKRESLVNGAVFKCQFHSCFSQLRLIIIRLVHTLVHVWLPPQSRLLLDKVIRQQSVMVDISNVVTKYSLAKCSFLLNRVIAICIMAKCRVSPIWQTFLISQIILFRKFFDLANFVSFIMTNF